MHICLDQKFCTFQTTHSFHVFCLYWSQKSWKTCQKEVCCTGSGTWGCLIPPNWLLYVRNTLFLSTFYNQGRKAVSAGTIILLYFQKHFELSDCPVMCTEQHAVNLSPRVTCIHTNTFLLVRFQWYMERQISPVSKTFRSDYRLLSQQQDVILKLYPMEDPKRGVIFQNLGLSDSNILY